MTPSAGVQQLCKHALSSHNYRRDNDIQQILCTMQSMQANTVEDCKFVQQLAARFMEQWEPLLGPYRTTHTDQHATSSPMGGAKQIHIHGKFTSEPKVEFTESCTFVDSILLKDALSHKHSAPDCSETTLMMYYLTLPTDQWTRVIRILDGTPPIHLLITMGSLTSLISWQTSGCDVSLHTMKEMQGHLAFSRTSYSPFLDYIHM